MSDKKRYLLEKELKKCERKAAMLFGTEKYHQIEKNHKRIIWLRKKLGIKNEPRRISLAQIIAMKMMAQTQQ